MNFAANLNNAGRLLALDLGTKRVGVAVCDELRLTTRPRPALARASWKKLLAEVRLLAAELEAVGLVIGLPLSMDGTEGTAATEARRLARNFSLSLQIPVYLQDERLTSREAAELLGRSHDLDSAAAALILQDFLASQRTQKDACPCCRYKTLSGRNHFQLCPVCFWEDDGQDDHDADDVRGGPNALLSLSQARENFQKFGACEERFQKNIRKPLPEEF
jgi:putative transcription antitermination factor YqgF